jgi:hypothetical protein
MAPSAEAGRGRGHVRFGGGARVHAHVRGNVSVGWSRPAYRRHAGRGWSVGGRIYVGPRVHYYPRYYYPRHYYYTPVPSYYTYRYEQNYYPVHPGTPAPQVAAVMAPPPRPDLPKLGIGLFAGGVSVEDQDDSSDVGAIARLRIGNSGFLIEGELGKTTYRDDIRVDRRLGASLIYEFGAYNKLAPYVLAGLGVQQAEVEGDFETRQNFGELGVGLRWAITPHFHLLFDVRGGTRENAEEQVFEDRAARVAAPIPQESEDYTRGRLAAMLYF